MGERDRKGGDKAPALSSELLLSYYLRILLTIFLLMLDSLSSFMRPARTCLMTLL